MLPTISAVLDMPSTHSSLVNSTNAKIQPENDPSVPQAPTGVSASDDSDSDPTMEYDDSEPQVEGRRSVSDFDDEILELDDVDWPSTPVVSFVSLRNRQTSNVLVVWYQW